MCHNVVALNSSKSLGYVLQRLSANGTSFKAIIIECRVTPEPRSLILIEMVAYLSMNDYKDFSLD